MWDEGTRGAGAVCHCHPTALSDLLLSLILFPQAFEELPIKLSKA